MSRKEDKKAKAQSADTTATDPKSEEVNAQKAQEATQEPKEEATQEPKEEAAQDADNAQTDAAEQAPQPSAEEVLRGQLALMNDKYLRLQAEFDNYRKRTSRERLDLVLTAGEDTIKGILPVLDDCQRAITTLEQLDGADANALEGIRLIYQKLKGYLESKGLKTIEAKGLDLDTDKHAAIAKIPAPSAALKGKIVDVVMEGYTLNGKVIRFANVVVGE